MIRRTVGIFVFAAALCLSSCTTDAVTLPEGFNENKVKVITVASDVDLGPLQRPLSGLQGGPAETVLGDVRLLDQFSYAGVDAVRLPQGYLCEYLLSGIFENPSADPDDPKSYKFDPIDNAMQVADAVPTRSAVILWQAVWDVGLTHCDASAQLDGRGMPPENKELWAKVVVNTLRHFNSDLLSGLPAGVWDDPNPRQFHVRHVEFLDDPLGRGGYADVDAVVADFVLFADAVKTAFPNKAALPNQPAQPQIHVVGPAITVASVEDAMSGAIPQFLDKLKALGKDELLDVLSFETAVTLPRDNGLIAQALRTVLEERGLSDRVQLWVSRYQPNPDLAESAEPANDLEVGSWSIFNGAFATASRIHWQNTVDRAIFYRGDRRHRSIDGSNISIVEPSPLWDKGGNWRPAGITWLPWRKMVAFDDSGNALTTRLQVTAAQEVDQGGLAALAARENLTCPDTPPGGETCPKIYVLLANTNTQLGQTRVDYQLRITGLDASEGAHKVRVNWSTVDETTSEFTYEETSLITLIQDELFYQFPSSVPGVDFLEIELKPR